MSWFISNWDKIVGVFLSVVMAGLIGFFSAILSVEEKISQLKTEIVQLRVELDKAVKPKLNDIERHADKITILEKTVLVLTTITDELKGQNKTLSSQTHSILMLQWQKGAIPSQPPRKP